MTLEPKLITEVVGDQDNNPAAGRICRLFKVYCRLINAFRQERKPSDVRVPENAFNLVGNDRTVPGEALNNLSAGSKSCEGHFVFRFEVLNRLQRAFADLLGVGTNTPAYVEKKENRKRQFVLAEVRDVLPDIVLEHIKVFSLQTAEGPRVVFLKDLNVHYNQFDAKLQRFVGLDLLGSRFGPTA